MPVDGLLLGCQLIAQKLEEVSAHCPRVLVTLQHRHTHTNRPSISTQHCSAYRLVVQMVLSVIWLTCNNLCSKIWVRSLWLFTSAMPFHPFHATAFLMLILLFSRLCNKQNCQKKSFERKNQIWIIWWYHFNGSHRTTKPVLTSELIWLSNSHVPSGGCWICVVNSMGELNRLNSDKQTQHHHFCELFYPLTINSCKLVLGLDFLHLFSSSHSLHLTNL